MLRFLFVLALIAAAIYAVFWLLDRRSDESGGRGGSGGGSGGSGGTPPRGPLGPDDDEDFLRQLERRRRHENGGQPEA